MSGLLIYANTPSTAVKLSHLLDSAHVIRPDQAREGQAALARGETVVGTFEAFNSDIRLPRGCRMMFDPECPCTGPDRARAEVRSMILDAILPSREETAKILYLLEKCQSVFPEGYDPFAEDRQPETYLDF